MPLIFSASPPTFWTVSVSASRKAAFMVLADCPGMSMVRVRMPSLSMLYWIAVMVFVLPLNPFNDGGDAHAAADAERGEAEALVPAFEFVEQGAQDHAAGGAQWMPHGDGAAVDVHFLVRDVQLTLEPHDYGGKCLIHLEKIDLIRRHAGLVQRLARGRGRAGEHDGGIGAGYRGGHDAGTGLQPKLLPMASPPISMAVAPSTMPEELPGVWTWLIFST